MSFKLSASLIAATTVLTAVLPAYAGFFVSFTKGLKALQM